MLKKILQFVASLVGCALLIAGPLVLIKISQFKAMGAAAAATVMPPTPVTASPTVEQTWVNSLVSTGSVVPVQGVTVGAETPGKVVKIAFEPGATVEAGALLVQLDTSTEEAQLHAAEATAALAGANLTRARELRQSGTNSPADLDAAEAQSKQAAAQAESLRAIIAKKSIRAAFSGRLGLRLVNLGQILKDGEAITTLQTLDPIFVNFSLPQQRLSEIGVGNSVRVTTDAAPNKTFEGRITAINAEVDPVTRNVRVQATITNREEHLRAGMFVNVEVVLQSEQKVLVVPATAILYAPYGDSVFLVIDRKDEKSGKVEKVLQQQFVRLGSSRGDFVSISHGLKAGDTVVTTGAFKLRSGMPVVIDNKLALDPKLAPKPRDS